MIVPAGMRLIYDAPVEIRDVFNLSTEVHARRIDMQVKKSAPACREFIQAKADLDLAVQTNRAKLRVVE